MFVVSLSFFIIAYLLNNNKKRLTTLIQRFPNLKYELLLAIPLAFSTAMLTNLLTSVPFDEYPIRKIIPPEVIMVPSSDDYSFDIEVAPNKLLIKPEIGSQVKEYFFPQLPANDYKLFEITTKNAILLDKNEQLRLKALDNKPIKMQFRTEVVWKALIITIISWCLVLGFILTHLVMNKRRS